ncbi:MAG: carbohydrate ABC transporter permease [Bacteroidota bacterium]
MKRYSSPDNLITVSLFLLPSLLGFVMFLLIPIISMICLAFTNYSGGANLSFIGLDNFFRIFENNIFRKAMINTGFFTLITVLAELFLGFVFAILLNKKMIGRTFFRSILFLPNILSNIAVALVFTLIFNASSGPINGFLKSIGLPGLPWLTSPKTALLTIALVAVWQSFGYYMVLFLSGLQTISPEVYEASEIDGASPWQKLWLITVPLLSPTTFFCVIMAIINSFKVFDQIFAMTGGQLGGGPASSTTVLVFDIYQRAFTNLEMGYASAEAVILFVIVLIVTIIQYRGQNKWVTYE